MKDGESQFTGQKLVQLIRFLEDGIFFMPNSQNYKSNYKRTLFITTPDALGSKGIKYKVTFNLFSKDRDPLASNEHQVNQDYRRDCALNGDQERG